LNLQEKTVREFIARHPDDSHFFEARLRLARLLRVQGDFQNSEKPRAESRRLMDELDKSAATPEQKAEVSFSRISMLMAGLREPTPQHRDELLDRVRKFQADFPADRRLAALLAETATIFDSQPKVKEALLEDAQKLAHDDLLKNRIADDLKRIGFLGQEVPLHFVTADGKAVDLADFRGKVVLVIFFAAWSPPSITALQTVQKSVAALPPGRMQVLGVSLDDKPEALAATIKQNAVTWPVGYDGKGWEGALVRSLGINSLPTLWLFDAKGRLRSLSALEGIAGQGKQLMDERP
jgi:peroxiredoxin